MQEKGDALKFLNLNASPCRDCLAPGYLRAPDFIPAFKDPFAYFENSIGLHLSL